MTLRSLAPEASASAISPSQLLLIDIVRACLPVGRSANFAMGAGSIIKNLICLEIFRDQC